MACLVIKKIIYSGKHYQYISPELNKGLNILEGKNGSGKTTFSDLICYGLGIFVRQFNSQEDELHKEIMNDTENYVILNICIDLQRYILKRYINFNTIFIEDANEVVEALPVYRKKGEVNKIFSDWLLDKLEIEVVEIYQGSKKFKINISDLFRLIYYDQETLPRKIYKEHRNDGNFFADSLYIRKVIFELLTGYQFSEYYFLLGKLYKRERERDTAKALLDNYYEMVLQMGYGNSLPNTQSIDEELLKLKDQLEKITDYKDNLKNIAYDTSHLDIQIQRSRKELIETDNKLSEQKSNDRRLSYELNNLNELKVDTILEVTQLKKIIATHEKLNLFSPDTCPCCLQHVTRKENHCICGASLARVRQSNAILGT